MKETDLTIYKGSLIIMTVVFAIWSLGEIAYFVGRYMSDC